MSIGDIYELFLFTSNWDSHLNLWLLFGAVLYLCMTGPWKRFFPHHHPVKPIQKIIFLLSLMIYYFALGSPLSLLAHELFSFHMLQMSLLYFIIPPLFLLGIPAYICRPLFKIKGIKKISYLFLQPIFTLFFFNGLISIYHIPYIFDSIMKNQWFHNGSHILLFFASLCMWWPIIGPVPELDRLKPLHKLGLIFGNGILLTPACAIITFTDQVIFKSYMKSSEIFPLLSSIHDQQLGGVIMKITQEVVYITAIGLVFIRWINEEKARDKQDQMLWNRMLKEKDEEIRNGDG